MTHVDCAVSFCRLLPAVAADGQLEQLRLHYNQSAAPDAIHVLKTEAGFAWEALSPCLRMLWVSNCNVMANLVQSLAQLQCLTSLSFVNCNFGSRISELGTAVGKLTSLQEREIEGSATALGIDAVKNLYQLVGMVIYELWRPALLQATAPAATATAGLLDTIAGLGRQEQLRSLRLSLTAMPPARAVGYTTSATQKKAWAPWAARVAAASRLTRLALGRHMLDDMDDSWYAHLALKLSHLQVRVS
jgi:hypothetical protein